MVAPNVTESHTTKQRPKKTDKNGGVEIEGVGDIVDVVTKLIKDVLPTALVRIKACDCKKVREQQKECPWTVLGPQNNGDQPLPYDIKIGNTAETTEDGEGVEIDFGDGKPQSLGQGISGPYKGNLPTGKSIKIRYCAKRGNALVAHWPGSTEPPKKDE